LPRYTFQINVALAKLVIACRRKAQRVDSRLSRLISFTTKQNLHDFPYEGGAPINSGSQIPVVNENREYGLIVKSVIQLLPCVLKLIKCF
jgi:hypothetical protein